MLKAIDKCPIGPFKGTKLIHVPKNKLKEYLFDDTYNSLYPEFIEYVRSIFSTTELQAIEEERQQMPASNILNFALLAQGQQEQQIAARNQMLYGAGTVASNSNMFNPYSYGNLNSLELPTGVITYPPVVRPKVVVKSKVKNKENSKIHIEDERAIEI